MSKSISEVAQLAMDMFYQSYRPADAFLRLKHFVYLCIAADGKVKKDEYDNQVIVNLRKRLVNAQVKLSDDNFITEDVPVVKSTAKLSNSIFSYPDVGYDLSISSLVPENNCMTLMPTSLNEKWQTCNIKDVVFYYPDGDKVHFINKELCKFDKIKISYIPQLNENSYISQSREFLILNLVNAYIKSAKEGVLIDISNDGNPNTSARTELNSYLFGGRK